MDNNTNNNSNPNSNTSSSDQPPQGNPFDQSVASTTLPPPSPLSSSPPPPINPLPQTNPLPPTDPNSFMNSSVPPPPPQTFVPTPSPTLDISTQAPVTPPLNESGTVSNPNENIQPSWQGLNNGNSSTNPVSGADNQPPPSITEQAPTDLSHLITDTTDFTNSASLPANTQAETLVTPNGNVSSENTSPTTAGGKGIPKWIIGLGVGLLLAVLAASAYFILGIGQPQQNTSLPATTENTTTKQVKPPAPSPSPAAQPEQEASGSANFGELDGSSRSSSTSQAATSAADLLRLRQRD